MKIKKLLSLLLAVTLLLPNAALAASWEDFSDVSGHWAAADLQRAVSDGLLTGTTDSTLSPDAPITTAQMLAVLNRVLSATQETDTVSLSVPEGAWYAQDVAKAAYLGLIPENISDYDAPLARQDALSMLARAFGLTPANQSATPLAAFSDVDKLTAENTPAVANLVSRGLVKGFDGALNANGSVTRAEFVTLLYRIAGTFTDAVSLSSGTSVAVLKGNSTLKDVTADRLCLDCGAKTLSLENTKVGELTLRCDTLEDFTMDSASSIGTLTLALGASSDFKLPKDANIGTLRLLSAPKMTADAQTSAVEVTGKGLYVNVSGKHSVLAVAGSGNTVTLAKDAESKALTVCGSGNIVAEAGGYGNTSVSAGNISVWGSKNSVTAATTGGSAAKLYLAGSSNKLSATLAEGFSAAVIDGSHNTFDFPLDDTIANGQVGTLKLAGSENTARIWSDSTSGACSVTGSACWLTLSTTGATTVAVGGAYNTVVKTRDGSVDAVTLGGTSSLFNAYVGNALKTVTVDGAKDQLKLDGTADKVTVNGQGVSLTGSGKIASLVLNGLDSTVTVTAEKTDDSGAKKALAEKKAAEEAAKKAAAEAAAAEAAKQKDAQRVLALVTTGYHGNYTLAWAQNHDYTPMEKKTWVQAKGYSSSTGWLIWVNLTMQRVNIFRGGQGNWDLCYSCIVGTGASGSGTPVGVYTTTYKNAAGWTTSTYNVHPVVGFKTGTGYAFHSRLFYPNGKTLKDASIGYPISHGCVRMYDEDVNYIYNNVPIGTTVVVY